MNPSLYLTPGRANGPETFKLADLLGALSHALDMTAPGAVTGTGSAAIGPTSKLRR